LSSKRGGKEMIIQEFICEVIINGVKRQAVPLSVVESLKQELKDEIMQYNKGIGNMTQGEIMVMDSSLADVLTMIDTFFGVEAKK
jgi:hypothetical protein